MSENEETVVLVADDEPSTLALVTAHVRSKGFKVIEASDGEMAWQLAHQHLPHLVILDVMMPGMSGWEVCRKIRESLPLAHTGVIMLTGIGENLNEMTSPLYGADSHVDKPFEFGDLDDAIEETLAKRRDGAFGRADGADEEDADDEDGDDEDLGEESADDEDGDDEDLDEEDVDDEDEELDDDFESSDVAEDDVDDSDDEESDDDESDEEDQPKLPFKALAAAAKPPKKTTPTKGPKAPKTPQPQASTKGPKPAVGSKASAKRISKKATKKAAKKASVSISKKAAKKVAKVATKGVKKATKKVSKKAAKKVAKTTAKKVTKKVSKKAAKKAAKKASKKK